MTKDYADDHDADAGPVVPAGGRGEYELSGREVLSVKGYIAIRVFVRVSALRAGHVAVVNRPEGTGPVALGKW
jgi:hypothetical protein